MRIDTPSFDFDEQPPSPTPAEVDALHSATSDWQEVPQARFLSWSPRMQWAYCRDRDLDSAAFAEDRDDAQFYLARAACYAQLIVEAA